MQHAIPTKDYSADERAERARGAAIAFLVLASAVPLALASALVLLVVR